ncbi:MAG: hypothetical protein WB755_02290, partial [Terriglobales bacterium]
MSGRRILPLVLFILMGLVLSPGLGESQSSSAARSGGQIVATPLAGEPAGASRCKVCHAAEVEGYTRSAMA